MVGRQSYDIGEDKDQLNEVIDWLTSFVINWVPLHVAREYCIHMETSPLQNAGLCLAAKWCLNEPWARRDLYHATRDTGPRFWVFVQKSAHFVILFAKQGLLRDIYGSYKMQVVFSTPVNRLNVRSIIIC